MTTIYADRLHEIDVPHIVDDNGPGFVLAVIRGGEVLQSISLGSESADSEGRPLGRTTIFYIASLSKQFTAASIALLADDGVLTIDDPVRRYIPELPRTFDGARLHHLLYHTSGAPDADGLDTASDESGGPPEDWWCGLGLWEVIGVTVDRSPAPEFHPGSAYRYSNTGYRLLAGVVERATGMSLARYAAQRIFSPLSMNLTWYREDDANPQVLTGHRVENGALIPDQRSFYFVGDGGVFTNLEDLARWDTVFAESNSALGEALSRRLQCRGHLDDGTSLHYGWGLSLRHHHGMAIQSHGGSFVGYQAKYVRFPQVGASLIGLANREDLDVDGLTKRAADLVLGQVLNRSLPDWSATLSPDGHYLGCGKAITP